MAPRLFWNAPASPDGAEFESLSAHGVPVRQGCSPVEGSDVSFPAPGGGVALVEVGGGGLFELRGTSDGQTLTWDAGSGQWVAGAAGTSPLTVATDVDDFRNVNGGGDSSGNVVEITPALVIQPVFFDLPWSAYNNNGIVRFEQNSGSSQVDHPGVVLMHVEGGSNDYGYIYRGFGVTGAAGRNGGIVYNPAQVADHSWVHRGLSTSNANYRWGLWEQIDVGFTAGIFSAGSYKALGWVIDSGLTGNGNLWATGANFGSPVNVDTGISTASFVSTFRRYSVRPDASVANRWHWFIDDVEVLEGDVPFTAGSDNLKPMFYIRSGAGNSVRALIDYTQTVTKTLSR